MNINRDNYEEYFLLYADNELSQEEKTVVEDFVKQNPELEEEFLMIKLSVSKPDENCVLKDKSFLLKEPTDFINLSNYPEIFVLYNDDELTVNERKETEGFLSANPSIKNEFELLQRTKLVADNRLVFPNKKLLYKKENNGRVISIVWWKALAAATVVAAGLWLGVGYLQRNQEELPVTVEKNTITNTDQPKTPVNDIKTIEPVNVVADKETKPQKQKLIVKRNPGKPSIKNPELTNDLLVVKNQKQPNSSPERDIVKGNEKEKPIVQAEDNIDPIKETIDADNSAGEISKENHLLVSNDDPETKAVTASFAVDENENSNNYAFYNVPQDKFNRSKIGGFLRKVKRIIERKISPLSASKDKTEFVVN
jgi:hypothetical protein